MPNSGYNLDNKRAVPCLQHTMEKTKILDQILKEKLVAIIRLPHSTDIEQVVKALVTGGVKVLEITSNTPGYLDGIKEARNNHPNTIVGAGTVTNKEIAKKAIASGAQFLVTPNTKVEVIQIAHEHNIPVLMGAMTPTEITEAVEAGADIIKLFPAGPLGLNYFKTIKGPFKTVNFFAVGGINTNNAQEWLNAGALGVGVGGSLAKPIKSKTDFEETVTKANQFIKLLKPL